ALSAPGSVSWRPAGLCRAACGRPDRSGTGRMRPGAPPRSRAAELPGLILVTSTVLRTRRTGNEPSAAQAWAGRPLAIRGAIASSAAAGTGLVILVLLVLIGWIAAPHARLGLSR